MLFCNALISWQPQLQGKDQQKIQTPEKRGEPQIFERM